MRYVAGTHVILLGCEDTSPAYKFGIRVDAVGIVIMSYGYNRCCEYCELCSTVNFINDSGESARLCVQDVHLRLPS